MPHLIDMPRDGLFRVERWADLYTFPPAAEPARLSQEPMTDGYRWEDLYGVFATAKFSELPSAAIGRSVARYRERRVEDPAAGAGATLSITNIIKGFLTAEPDDGPPIGPANCIPPSYFEDAYQMELEHLDDVQFIDLEHPDTHATLAEMDGDLFAFFGLSDSVASISASRNRRVTRLATSLLNQWSQSDRRSDVVGLRYRSQDPGWDGYVIWDPVRLRYDRAAVTPLSPCDAEVRAAAAQLGLDDPCPAR